MPTPESLLERLVRQQVEFVIVGGFAAVAHGVTLLTQDIDICCRFSEGNLRRLDAALVGLNPVHYMTPKRLPLELTSELCSRLQNLYLDTDNGQLDCLSSVLGLGDFEEVHQRSVAIEMPFGPCRILTLDALITAKEAMGRPRDWRAVAQLREIKQRTSGGAAGQEAHGGG